MTAPGPLSPTRELTFRSGAETLHGEWFEAKDARGVAIVLHGYAEHCGRYREVAHVLVQAGVAVFSYDMRGHGRSTGRRGHVDRYEDYLADLRAARAQADALAAAAGCGARRALVAHSNGSLVALRALIDADPPAVDAAILASPFLALRLPVPAIKRGAARVLSRILPALAMSNELRLEILTHDAGKLAERAADTLCHGVATARFFTEATAAQARVRAEASRIRVPTLWTIGGADQIADASVSAAVAGAVPGAEVVVLDGQFHEVWNEVERGATFARIDAFVRRVLT